MIQVLPGGHCFHCHQDFTEERHKCWENRNVAYSTPCTEVCKDSKFVSKGQHLPSDGHGQWFKKQESKGLGDTISKITHALGIEECEGCGNRKEILNKAFPYKRWFIKK